jgi:N-acetylmuramoyl-L-alanine amidase
MATVFQNFITQRTGWRNRGVKASNDLYVLRHTAMPAVLTESGFYTDPEQAADLMTDRVRQHIADAHIAAILILDKQ